MTKNETKTVCSVPNISYIWRCRQHCGNRQAHLSAVRTIRRVFRGQSTRHCATDLTARHRCTPEVRPCADSAADTAPCNNRNRIKCDQSLMPFPTVWSFQKWFVHQQTLPQITSGQCTQETTMPLASEV